MHEHWRNMLAFSMATCGLSPAQFWRMSLPELRVLMQEIAPAAPEATSREMMEALIRTHPDTARKENHDI